MLIENAKSVVFKDEKLLIEMGEKYFSELKELNEHEFDSEMKDE